MINFYILTLFPEMIQQSLSHSILLRAKKNNLINITCVNIRDFSNNKHNHIDDTPYGGGAGMVMQAQPIYDAWKSINLKSAPVIYMTPQGKPFNQNIAKELSNEDNIIILCGHYEGVDERIIEEIVTDEISIGDFILTGGELAACIVVDSVSRLVPKVLGKEISSEEESFSDNLLEYPQYTKPKIFMNRQVPDILLSGHHANIKKWRHEQSLIRTYNKRQDLLVKANISDSDRLFLKNYIVGDNMKQNKYDDDTFFIKYSQMERSKKGLEAAGEWNTLRSMLPDFKNKHVLDLGCGFGWHCRYAVEQGATSVIGVDISEKMLAEAKNKTEYSNISYICKPIEDIDFDKNSFDIVISSLAFHYIKSFEGICDKVNKYLCDGGKFIFSVEHPVFTAYGTQDWYYDGAGNILHWPVDNYFYDGEREANFLGERVIKYHRTLTTYINTLLVKGFKILELKEPQPNQELLETVEGMKDELRRPMMLIISSQKI